MEKKLLNIRQTEALDKISKSFTLDPNNQNEGNLKYHFDSATDYCEEAEGILNEIKDAIYYAVGEIYNYHGDDAMKHLVNTPDALYNLKNLIKHIEDELGRGVQEFENATKKTNLKLIFSDNELLEIINKYEHEFDNYDFEKSGSDIFIIFRDLGVDETEETHHKIRIATNAEYDYEIDFVNQYIAELLHP